MNKSAVTSLVVGLVASGVWINSDAATFSKFGWIVVCLFTLTNGLLMELVWSRKQS